jgi:hypothetical protein
MPDVAYPSNKHYDQATPSRGEARALDTDSASPYLSGRRIANLSYAAGVSGGELLENADEALPPPKYDYRAKTGLHFQPPRNALIQAQALLRGMDDDRDDVRALQEQGRQLWLSSDMRDAQQIKDYYKKLWKVEYNQTDAGQKYSKKYMNDKRDESLANEFIRDYSEFEDYSGSGESSKEHWSGLYDNIYGRKFESDVARQLVENPLPEMLQAAKAMGEAVAKEVDEKLYSDEFMDWEEPFLEALKKQIKKDMRPWFKRAPQFKSILERPDIDTLKTALTHVENGFDMISIPYLIIKIGLALRGTAEGQILEPKWLKMATRNYMENITHDRSTLEADEKSLTQTSGYGIRLPHHPPYESAGSFDNGINWTTAKPLRHQLRSFAQNALHAGFPVVCGMSGSSNIMSFFLRDAMKRGAHSSTGAEMLCVLAFLAFDGGHSFNEAMYVYHATTKLPASSPEKEMWTKWRNGTVDYKFHYNQLTDLPASTEGKNAVNKLLGAALDNTLDYFKKYDVSQSRNEAAIAKMRSGGYQVPKLETVKFSDPNMPQVEYSDEDSDDEAADGARVQLEDSDDEVVQLEEYSDDEF